MAAVPCRFVFPRAVKRARWLRVDDALDAQRKDARRAVAIAPAVVDIAGCVVVGNHSAADVTVLADSAVTRLRGVALLLTPKPQGVLETMPEQLPMWSLM